MKFKEHINIFKQKTMSFCTNVYDFFNRLMTIFGKISECRTG